jgi:DNA polymerase elongation subunit (family B)
VLDVAFFFVHLSLFLLSQLLRKIQTEHALETYSIEETCQEFLHHPEEYLPLETLRELASSNSPRLASYALRRSSLPIVILHRLMAIPALFELCRATGINLRDMYSRGQIVRSWSLLLRHASRLGFVIPAEGLEPGALETGPLVFDPTAIDTTGLHTLRFF